MAGNALIEKITFNSVIRGNFNTANSRFIAPTTGDFNIIGGLQVLQSNGASVDDAIYIYKNGLLFSRGGNVFGTPYPFLYINDVVPLAVGDFVEIFVRAKTSGTSVEGSAATALFTGALVP